MDDIRGLTSHASRVNGTVSVAAIPWRFTYLCWSIPIEEEPLSLKAAESENCDPLPRPRGLPDIHWFRRDNREWPGSLPVVPAGLLSTG